MKDVVLAGWVEAVAQEDMNVSTRTWARTHSNHAVGKLPTVEPTSDYTTPQSCSRNGDDFLYCRARPPW